MRIGCQFACWGEININLSVPTTGACRRWARFLVLRASWAHNAAGKIWDARACGNAVNINYVPTATVQSETKLHASAPPNGRFTAHLLNTMQFTHHACSVWEHGVNLDVLALVHLKVARRKMIGFIESVIWKGWRFAAFTKRTFHLEWASSLAV